MHTERKTFPSPRTDLVEGRFEVHINGALIYEESLKDASLKAMTLYVSRKIYEWSRKAGALFPRIPHLDVLDTDAPDTGWQAQQDGSQHRTWRTGSLFLKDRGYYSQTVHVRVWLTEKHNVTHAKDSGDGERTPPP